MPTAQDNITPPIVSVVIPCYNQGRFLWKAIESVLRQTYTSTEIVVVDDGSTDNTRAVAESYAGVKYVYQQNKGLSAARNTGIRNSTGSYLLFLDADDWLYPKGIEANLSYLVHNPEKAFVSGTFDAFYMAENLIREGVNIVTSDHYCRLLQGNYIGMIAAVLFQRWVFKEFTYDETLRNCEDYDLYLRVARKYPIYHHQHKIAAYRFHASNMSAHIPAMLAGSLHTLSRQKEALVTVEEKRAFKQGKDIWKNYYCKELYKELLSGKAPASRESLSLLVKYKPSYLIRFTLKENATMIKSNVKKLAPAFGLRWLYNMGLYTNHLPETGRTISADFKRVKPLSANFGYDRGGPIDRYYIENFLHKESGSIKGNALEIGDNEYTMLYGGDRIVKSDILHIDDKNPKATLIGDISHAPQLPDNTFDTIVLTQTLHLIYDFKGALETCHRILKPGGTLLMTVPGITPIDHGEWKNIWYWSFTDKSIKRLMTDAFAEGDVEVKTFGNVYAASSFLYGLGLPEVPKEKLDYHDPHYQMIITVKAVKAGAK